MSADRKALKRAAVLAALVTAGLSSTAVAADGQAAPPPVLDPALRAAQITAVAEAVRTRISPEVLPEDQKRAMSLVRGLLAERKTSRSDVAGRLIQPLDRRQAAVRGLEANLDLAMGRQEPERVQTLLREVRAVYDPVFDLQLGYNRSQSFFRGQVGLVKLNPIVSGIYSPAFGGEFIPNDPLSLNSDGSPKIFPNAGLAFEIAAGRRLNLCVLATKPSQGYGNKIGCPGEPSVSPQPVAQEFTYTGHKVPGAAVSPFPALPGMITANSTTNSGHPLQRTNLSLGLTQELPWGGSLQLIDNTIQQKIYYRADDFWEDGQFSSSLNAALNTPLPFTKGFGPDNSANSAIKAREIARKSADWALKDLVNLTLRDIDIAYFELVRQLESLVAAVDRQKSVQKLKERQDRILKQDPGLITRYQQAQLESEVTKAGLDIETQLQNYLSASVTLSGLIGDPDAHSGAPIYLPYGYGREMESKLAVTMDQALATAKANRPDFFIVRLDRDSADVSLKLAENQALPDLQASINANAAENGSTYGYSTPVDSQMRLIRPDTLTHSYGLTFTRPWGNRSALAAVEIARLSVEDRDIAIQSTEIAVKREITGSLADLQSARAQSGSAKIQAKALRSAYESQVRQLEAGLIGEDQVLQASRNLLAAELALTGARIDARETETRLLYAEGVIANVLPVQTASSALERRRLDLLADAGHLKYLSPEKK